MTRQIRSKTRFRRKKVRTPSGKTVTHYIHKKPKQASCARCSRRLSGVPREIPSKMGKMTRSERSVSREYGGVLCSKCVIQLEKYKTRIEAGLDIRRDLTVEKFLPLGWYVTISKQFPKAEEKPKSEVKETKPKPEKKAAKKATKEKAESKKKEKPEKKKKAAKKEEKKTKKKETKKAKK
ncbi:MAG: hypothetical protein JXB14_04015 [Candidatus Altiarchaeota archaeon]|nr:hypothetical protein [Candidatus Altiarchaeota archaeon]